VKAAMRLAGVVLVGAGLLLLILGYQSAKTGGEVVGPAVTGQYRAATIWLLALGLVGMLGGGALVVLSRNVRTPNGQDDR
jgi:hypothetical protein